MGFFMFGWGGDSGEYTPSACHGLDQPEVKQNFISNAKNLIGVASTAFHVRAAYGMQKEEVQVVANQIQKKIAKENTKNRSDD